MNVFKRCACVAPCDHAYHFKFKHRGRTYRESTHIANHKLAGRAADRRRLQIAGRRAGLDAATDHTQVRLSDLRTMYDAWVVTTYRTPVHALKLSRLLAEFFPDDPYLVDISAFDLERWRSHRLKTISRRTLHAQFGIVKGMFRQAAIWFPGFARPDMGIGRTRPDEAAVPMLTPEELSYTLTQLPALLALMARVTLETLARLGEICGLTVHDVGPNWMQRRLKGGKRLKIGITPRLSADLRAYLRSPDQVMIFEVPAPARRHQPPAWRVLTTNNASHRFGKWFTQHHLRHLHHHCYRHTGISLMLDRGVNPKTIQTLAGWTSLQQLPRYGHVQDTAVTAAVEAAAAHVASLTAASGGHTAGHTAAKRIVK